MKKFISILLIIVLSFTLTISVFADFDLSSMDVNELNELRAAVDDEILAKGGNVLIAGGDYVVGVDIAPGTYEFALVKQNYAFLTHIDVNGEILTELIMGVDQYQRIKLEENQTLELEQPCYMRKGAMIGF